MLNTITVGYLLFNPWLNDQVRAATVWSKHSLYPSSPVSPFKPSVPCVPWVPWVPWAPCVPVVPVSPWVPWIPWTPWAPCVPWTPWTPWVPCTPCVPCVPCVPCTPCTPCVPCVPCTPCVPWAPLSPLLPDVTKETIISSLLINGDVADWALTAISIVHQPVLSVKSVILNNKKSFGSNLLDILTNPFTAEVTASIDVKNESILLPSTSVASIYISSEDACKELLSLVFPVPGSAEVVDVSKV